MSIFYTLIVTLAGHELVWGPGAEPPEIQGFWAINYCQMNMLFIPYLVDNGRSAIGVGSRVRFWAINNCQMSMLLYLIW